jgi:hypothetical protein
MNDAKYIGMDVHQATISVAVRDSRWKPGDGGHSPNQKLKPFSSLFVAWAAACT